MKQIEIDGEFFDNPVELRKEEIQKEVNRLNCEAIIHASSIEALKVTIGMVLSTPLFPNNFPAIGGIVLAPTGGDLKLSLGGEMILETGGTISNERHVYEIK